MGDGQDYLQGARSQEEFQFRRGYVQGIIETMNLLGALLALEQEDTELMERSRKAVGYDG